jgi:hypothetical protein
MYSRLDLALPLASGFPTEKVVDPRAVYPLPPPHAPPINPIYPPPAPAISFPANELQPPLLNEDWEAWSDNELSSKAATSDDQGPSEAHISALSMAYN